MDKMMVQQAIGILSMQFPISWEKIANKPELVTSDDLNQRLSLIGQLTSPDGTAWVPSIDNEGNVTWKKIEGNNKNGNQISNT
ncbi:hypothetical protein [Lactiplantibacillus plantarum]|uniref:hypothetical protein n=1 Tax=Lactiplantibacillus plantarum TaxID=1590 RepID=UPI0007AB7FF0|nr:hypothetical protein [Lactiplantibacillus plantarum]KZD99548.1 prophage Lp2 protein 51 [Lactiplantibacillus plantarum]MBE1726913.1 hypothetical protein [Lactiplantibacillus plantarum]NKI38772.1 hypothetical protein [Lactiplantibacillus plantarum]